MTPERRVVWITGASSGIGEAAARAFAQRGDRIALSARRHARLEALAQELRSRHPGLEVLPVPADVTVPRQVQLAAETIERELGEVDLLVANAGVAVMDLLENLDPHEGLETQLDTNLLGVILTAREVLTQMKRRRSGHILVVASLASRIGIPGHTLYAASKFGVRGFSEALRREVRPWGISVSVIYPGPVANGFGRKGEAMRALEVPRPPGFVVTSDQVAEAILRLADRPRREVVYPARYGMAIWLNARLPGLVDLITARLMRRLAPPSA